MRIELTNDSVETIKKAEKVMGTDYERKGNYIDIEGLVCIIRDLLWEIDNLEEKVEDTEAYYHDNYKPISANEMYGVSERDFH